MALDRPSPFEPGGVEQPTQYAELDVRLGPAESWGGAAKGRVPPENAHHFIATFGIVASVIAGIAGAVLTLRISAGLTGPAYAELGLAFGGAVLIAVRRAAGRAARQQEDSPGIRAFSPGRQRNRGA